MIFDYDYDYEHHSAEREHDDKFRIRLLIEVTRAQRNREFYTEGNLESLRPAMLMEFREVTAEACRFTLSYFSRNAALEPFAAQGQLERKQIGRQTRQKTKARLEAGYHAFISHVGFKYKKAKTGGKALLRCEPAASIIQEMMEGFAEGRFQTKREAKYFLESQPDFPKAASGKIGNNQVGNILSNPLYAGYIEYKPWGVTLRKGQHEGMVSYETFCKIQERLKGRAHAPARKDLNRDFPMP